MAEEKGKDYWLAARERVDRLRTLDPNCELVFGANIHRYRPLPTVSPARLEAFERRNEIPIPAEYRSFLEFFGAGGVGPDAELFNFKGIENLEVGEPFPFTESTELTEENAELLENISGILIIGTSGCASDNFLEFAGPQPGTVWHGDGDGLGLIRGPAFGTWYADWLDRIETGLEKHHLIQQMVDAGASVSEIISRIDHFVYRSKDEEDQPTLRFRDIPGQIQYNGDKVIKFEFGNCFIL